MNQNTNANFTEGQLTIIRSLAEECAQPDPTSTSPEAWALFVSVRDYCSGFTADELVVLDIIARLCVKNNLGAQKMSECVVEFNRLYTGQLLGDLPALCESAVRNCTKATEETGDKPGFFGPFSLN